MAKVVSIANPKGGTGKTTTAVHLARALQLAGMDTILLDTDPQQSALSWYGLDALAGALPVSAVPHSAIESTVKGNAGKYDLIVIDGAAKLEAVQMVPLLKVSDVMILPCQPSPLDIWGCATLADAAAARMEAVGKPVSRFLVTRAIQGTALAADVVEALEAQGLPVLESRLHQRVAFAEAFAAGQTVIEYEPEGKAAFEVQSLADDVKKLF